MIEAADNFIAADVMELADMQDLGSCAARRAGSSPVIRIKTPERRFRVFFADGDLESRDSRSPLPLRSVPGRRPPDVWHPVIRIISFKPFIYKGLELFLILDLSSKQSGK